MTPIQREAGLAFSRLLYRPETVLPSHTHRLSYISFVGKGAYRERAGRIVRECKPSTLIYHPAGETHENTFYAAPVELLRVEAENTNLFDKVENCRVPQSGASSRICRRMLIELGKPDPLTPMVLHGLALELAAGLIRQGKIEDRAPAWLRLANDLLAESLINPPSINEIANVSRVHPVHLCRTYRRFYGQTIGERVRELRLKQACEYLSSTKTSVGEIALACGFCDQSYLARVMRAELGVSPSEFRAACC